jgi:putative restriction endonuclease
MDSKKNDEFTAHLRGAVREAERLGYKPKRFKSMIDELGGFETVKRILSSGRPSEGFTRLWQLKRIDLTCEAIVVETPWRRFFDPEIVLRSEKLLRDSKYAFKPYAEPALTTNDHGHEFVSGPHGSDERKPFEDCKEDPALYSSISSFFRDVLTAPLANVRWSWGTVDDRARRVFLRLWRLDLRSEGEVQLIQVREPFATRSQGLAERERHIGLIGKGYSAYGVLCDMSSPGSATIRDFDKHHVLRLGRIVEESQSLLMEVVERIPTSSIRGGALPATIHADLRELNQDPISETTRTALIDARLGQGRFRRELMRRWDDACAVTGCRVSAMLRASHSKPWRKSDNAERLDSNNGLILSANLDALFDSGLISFESCGRMLVAGALASEEQAEIGIPMGLRRAPNAALCRYLAYHREHVFLGRGSA